MLFHQDGTVCTGHGCEQKVHDMHQMPERPLKDITNFSKRLLLIGEPLKDMPAFRNSSNALALAELMLTTAVALVREGTKHEPMSDEKFNAIMGTFLETMCQITR